jgi:hypothetical protein
LVVSTSQGAIPGILYNVCVLLLLATLMLREGSNHCRRPLRPQQATTTTREREKREREKERERERESEREREREREREGE